MDFFLNEFKYADFSNVVQSSRCRFSFTFWQTECILKPTGFLRAGCLQNEVSIGIMLFEDHINIILIHPGYADFIQIFSKHA